MIVYCISGLGVDERMFGSLRWPLQYDVRHIRWIKPYPNEPFADYLVRLSQQIDHTQPFCLVGLSFGGIVAVEWSKMFNPLQTIIISSIPVSGGLPWYYRFPGRFIPAAFIPVGLLRTANVWLYRLFGADSRQAKQLLTDVMNDADPDFLRWAIHILLHWKNNHKPLQVFHIHGAADRVLPLRYVKPDTTVKAGTHLMVYTMAAHISDIINNRLKTTV